MHFFCSRNLAKIGPQKSFFNFWVHFWNFSKKESLTNGLIKRFVRQFATIPIQSLRVVYW